MNWPSTDPTIEISKSSGILRVVVHPARSWLVVLLELGVLTASAAVIYENWASMSSAFRGLFTFALASGVAGLLFQFSMTEIIEIDMSKITIRKDLQGWERIREYEIKECRELEWMEASEGTPQRLQFKIGWRRIILGKGLTETQAVQILKALQQILPNVAQQLCSYPEGKKHFITLGLS